MLDQLRLAIVDLETTGSSATFNRILEVGVHRVEQGRIIDTFQSLVDPGTPVPPDITRVTGLTDADVAGAPTFAAIAARVHALLEGCVFVAHNARFDYSFLRHEFARLGLPFQAPCLCTVRLSRALYPGHRRHSLSTLIERFGFAYAQRHRALDDAAVVWQFLEHVHTQLPAAQVSQAVQQLLHTPALPARLNPAAVDTLPESLGVYVFYDAQDAPLYVGKSMDVRARVWSHFTNDAPSGKDRDLAEQTARIETHAAHGELGALVLEAQLIDTLQPRLNRPRRAVAVPPKLVPWPYAGPVVLEECSRDRTQGHLFLCDQWQLQQALRYDEAGVARWVAGGAFDDACYRLLLRYLPAAGAQVRCLPPAATEQWLQDTLGLA